MKKKAPLVVVATLDPKSVSAHKLMRYSTPEGDFATTAGLEYVFSPYTGKEVAASSGKACANTINEDNAVGVICQSCKSINATTNTGRSEIFCVTCGTHLAYDLDGEELDEDSVDDILNGDGDLASDDLDDGDMIGGDELDVEDDGVEEDSCSKKTKAEVTVEDDADDSDDVDEPDTEDDEAPLDSFMESDEEAGSEDSDVDMTDVVDEDEDVDIVDVESSVLAMVSGHVVATMRSDNENAARVTTAAFKKAFKHAVATQGLRKALVSAGFTPKRILVKNVVAAAIKRADKEVSRKLAASEAASARRFASCLEIATAGGMIGMFSKEKAGVLLDELASVFASMNISNPKRVARTTLAKALAQHNKAIVNVACDLMTRDDAILSSYREQIESMGGIFAAAADEDETDETDTPVDDLVESRLVTPMRLSEKPAKRAEVATAVKTQITGLFQI